MPALLAAGVAITSSLDLQAVLNTVTHELARFLGVEGCAISEHRPDDSLVLLAEFGPDGWWDGITEPDTYSLDDYPLTREVIKRKKSVQMTVNQPGIDLNERDFMRSVAIKTLVMLPMVFQDRVIGLAEIMDGAREIKFTNEELAVAQLLANQAASAIENARLYEETQRRLKEQTTLREAGAVLSSSLEMNVLLALLAEQFCQAVAATSAYINIYKHETKTSIVLAEYISPQASAGEKISDLGESYLEERPRLILSGQPYQFQVDDPELDAVTRDHLTAFGACSMLIIPIQYLGHTTAFAEIWESREGRIFSPDVIRLCQDLAQQAALAIENARLYEAAQEEIAERVRMETALRESETRYELATRGANDGIWDWDIRQGTIFYSSRWAAQIGLEEKEIQGDLDLWLTRVHPDDIDNLQANLEAQLNGHTVHFENEHRILHQDGDYRWVLTRGLAVRDEHGEIFRFAGSQTDITSRKRAEDQLLHDAFHDALTGLSNRALFLDRLGRAIERNKRRATSQFAVLFLDLDRFKVINDSLGHTVGDLLLNAIARRLEQFLRTIDTVARLGGDEFVILLEDLDQPDSATQVSTRIQEELNRPFRILDHQIYTTVSIGIVIGSSSYERPEEILRDADIAMYRAKEQGAGQHQIFTKTMRSQAQARLALENELRRAIGLRQFLIVYQPIKSLDDGRITGFEALVRWQHPTRGLLNPAAFITIAEETGLIMPIDWWVLWEACRQIREWQAAVQADPPLRISINLSGKHFSNLDLLAQVKNLMDTLDLQPDCLVLEITENTIIENTLNATRLITDLRDLGVQVQIDDFGTGYSSLSYLQQYPIDAIKIDRSFITRMGEGENHAEIVRTIVALARELGMEAIAEGIETKAQLDQLRDLDCKFGQGYLLSRPISGEDAFSLLQANRVQTSQTPKASEQ